MSEGPRIQINYVTSSQYKAEENRVLGEIPFSGDSRVADLFEFRIREVPIKEVLEVDLGILVMAEVTEAYSQIKVPCVVEHAGLIFEGYEKESYPGGLTKPMWNALKGRFIQETQSGERRATARAVVAYCDGRSVHTFVGETKGSISSEVRGKTHAFYWDTVFIPDDIDGSPGTKTYAEIVEDPSLGIRHKVQYLSQSAKAMIRFLEYRRDHNPGLWSS